MKRKGMRKVLGGLHILSKWATLPQSPHVCQPTVPLGFYRGFTIWARLTKSLLLAINSPYSPSPFLEMGQRLWSPAILLLSRSKGMAKKATFYIAS